jgi:MFS family permease
MSSQRLLTADYKIIILSSLGGALEFFDFTIYALFASYLSANFFPEQNPIVALINTFAVFAVGYFVRPLGGILFGHFGDRYGRKNAFTISALVMALATLFMGLLPNYQHIGLWAPILLILLRIFQGISVGGEVPGAIVFIAEHLANRRPGLGIGFIIMGVTLGNVIGSLLFIFKFFVSDNFKKFFLFRNNCFSCSSRYG